MKSPSLLDGWHVGPRFLLTALALSFVVRSFMVFLRVFERPTGRPYWSTFATLFLGKGIPSSQKESSHLVPDYWHPFILGLLELLAYPVLMRIDALHVVGAWLGFKTLAQWKAWSDQRVAFNRLLIGNAVVLLLSVLVLAPLVGIHAAR